MGTLGEYLHNARVARNIDLRDAAQQTRISVQYLSALEQEDFTKLPGEVFVKGFLKNYSRFLSLDEAEVMKRYAELKPAHAASAPGAPAAAEKTPPPAETEARKGTPLEPFIWGAVIVVALLAFLFTYLPSKPGRNSRHESAPTAVISQETATVPALKPEKLYLEVVADEDTWLLVRTDDSPQKKAVLKKGDQLTWSADERFLLSYGRVGAVKLFLNGQELVVNGAKDTVVRDMTVSRAGIVNQPAPAKPARPLKPKSEPTGTVRQFKPRDAKPPAAVPSAPSPQPAAPAPAPSQPTQSPQAAAPPAAIVNPAR